MPELFNIKFLVSIFLLMVFPLSSAYYDAIRLAQLPKKQHAILGSMAMLTTIISVNFSFILIGQIDDKSFSVLNLLTVIIFFFIGRMIRKKFPDLFLKVLLKSNTEAKDQP
ncbi:MAG: hypothetical protein HGA36_03475 [Candidatus Moranbacteria bacterium]|nr:hypothetical protein [Candidatus Moranbacteria bacterium]